MRKGLQEVALFQDWESCSVKFSENIFRFFDSASKGNEAHGGVIKWGSLHQVGHIQAEWKDSDNFTQYTDTYDGDKGTRRKKMVHADLFLLHFWF